MILRFRHATFNVGGSKYHDVWVNMGPGRAIYYRNIMPKGDKQSEVDAAVIYAENEIHRQIVLESNPNNY